MKPKYIIIHSMANQLKIDGKLIHARDFLKSIGLSAHTLIDSEGHETHMKDWHEIARHAGLSKWKDDHNLNRCSVGIELLIDNVHNYTDFVNAIKLPSSFTDEHYKTCAVHCALICREFNLDPEQSILSHSEVSGDDVRGKGKGKVDVGEGFDMVRLISMTKAELINMR